LNTFTPSSATPLTFPAVVVASGAPSTHASAFVRQANAGGLDNEPHGLLVASGPIEALAAAKGQGGDALASPAKLSHRQPGSGAHLKVQEMRSAGERGGFRHSRLKIGSSTIHGNQSA
jgi:hypothetical protein